MDDNTIIHLFFSRSEDAITELDKRYGEGCRRLSSRILTDKRDAEECVNDAYLGVWNSVPPARPNPLAAFLYKIVRNLSLKRYRDLTRARRNTGCTAAAEELYDICGDGDPVADEVGMRELERFLNAFIQQLPRENRVIFLRRYWFMDAYSDIAKLTGLSEKNVSVRLTRIRKQLKQYLTEKGALL